MLRYTNNTKKKSTTSFNIKPKNVVHLLYKYVREIKKPNKERDEIFLCTNVLRKCFCANKKFKILLQKN